MTRRYLVSGSVQGVGFRYFVRSQARRMNVKGWVRNTRDGRVEAVATAELDVLALFEAALRSGPELSRVESVEASEATDEVFEQFEVRF
jgi:acylphosphatase